MSFYKGNIFLKNCIYTIMTYMVLNTVQQRLIIASIITTSPIPGQISLTNIKQC